MSPNRPPAGEEAALETQIYRNIVSDTCVSGSDNIDPEYLDESAPNYSPGDIIIKPS